MQENFIDLGLPSKTLWADRNVGASSPESKGDYFTFEEAQELGKVPSFKQCKELKDECEWNWEGKGYEVVGPNGNSIYLPAAGIRDGRDNDGVGSYGHYWSSDADYCSITEAFNLSFDNEQVFSNYDDKHDSQSVRLVK